MHYPIGFPTIGLTKVETTYPFQMPIVFFDEFFQGSSADFNTTATGPGTHYKLGGTNAATTAATNIAFVTSNDGGTLRFITTATSGDTMTMSLFSGTMPQLNSTTDPRPMIFQARIMPASITSAKQGLGWCTAASLNGSTREPITDYGTSNAAFGAYFQIIDGAVYWAYKTTATSTSSVTAAATYLEGPNSGSAVTIAAAAWSTFTIRFDGKGRLRFFVNGLLVKDATLASFTQQNVSPFWGVQTSTSATKTCDIDYLYMAIEAPAAGRG